MRTHLLSCLLGAALVISSALPLESGVPVTFDLVATLDYPGASQTSALGINDKGQVAGLFYDNTGKYGFTYVGGRFSPPITDPNDIHRSTSLTDINNNGEACGFYTGADDYFHDFIVHGPTFTELPVYVLDGIVLDLNDAGDVCGYSPELSVGFVVTNGAVATFTIPGSGQTTYPEGLNNLGECVGWYTAGGVTSGFIREPDGTLIYPIMAPGKSATYLVGIDDKGEMVGAVGDATGTHAAYFSSPTKVSTWDYPGMGDGGSTFFNGINKRGQICGSTTFATGESHSFIVQKSRGR